MKNLFLHNRICQLFSVQYPLIQAGMVWVSGWKLASAVSNAGGLGIIGAGSMYPEVFRHHIQRCKAATNHPFGVNIPLLYSNLEALLCIIREEEVSIVFTSAGSPDKYTQTLQSAGCTVVHVVSSSRQALKAEMAGCNAVVAEGFEAGGHNGREETTTLVLVPAVADQVKIPVIAAGGIASGRQMLAAMALGASGVQVGSRFVVATESSAHKAFKQKIITSKEGDTMLRMKKTVPVRLLDNPFSRRIAGAEAQGAAAEELTALLDRGRAKKGMFEGDMEEGELEIGQVASHINREMPASAIVQEIITGYAAALEQISRQQQFNPSH